MRIATSLLAAMVVAAAQPAAAQDTGYELSPMQVTSGRQGEPQFDVPQAVTVVNRAQVEALNPQVIAQALAYEPGAFFQQSGPGQGIVIVRGLKGSEVLHLVDGMRLNNAFFRNSPSQYLALVDPRNVERIELLRGPYGTVYGSDAMGGVVQIVTPEHRFASESWSLRGAARAHYGSADLERSGRVELATGHSGLSVAGGFSFADYGHRRLAEPGQSPDGRGGYTLAERVADTAYLSRAWDLKTLWVPGGEHELMAAAQYLEVPRLQRYFQTVPGYGPPPPARAIAEFRDDRTFYHLRYRYLLPLGFVEAIEVHAARQVMDDDRLDRRQDNSRDEFTFNRSTLDGLTAQAETSLATQRLRYGIELYRDTVASRAFRESPPDSGSYTFPDGAGFFSPFPDGSRSQDRGLYLLDEWRPTEALLVEGVARWSRHETRVAQGDRAFGATLTHEDWTGNAGTRYEITPALAWTVNAGRGFRAPNLFDLALVGQRAGSRVVIANLDLRPESVITLDTGFKYAAGTWAGEFSVFHSDYADRIVTVNPAFAEGTPECADDGDPATDGCAQNQNLARSTYWGFEGGARWSLAPAARLRATLNYTRGEQELRGVTTPANRVPPLNGQVGLEFRLSEGLLVAPSVQWAGRQDRLDPADRADSRIHPEGTPGYAVVHVRASWSPTPRLHLQLDVRNLLDKAYREHGSGIDAPGRGLGVTAAARF